ncbi:MAG: SLBB domain-containing protein [Ectothiorhodospiraceae bacterium]|nr:SLBB domain-containing protein [Ectothiorhodospiraceae bacterium]
MIKRVNGFSLPVNFLIVLSVALYGFLSVKASFAAPPTPTPEQLKVFQQLPAGQQQQLLKSISTTTPAKKAALLDMPTVVKPFTPNVTIAPVQTPPQQISKARPGKKIKPFGYDLFAGSPTTFSPVTEIPVPIDYIIGPGDTIQVQLFGKENAEYELIVNRDGQLQFPGIGPIAVTGMRFTELKDDLKRRINKKMLGVKPYVSLGTLRSMRVFVMGDVNRPGSYMVSALSTMTNALFVSGGVKTIGSLRDIQLKRNGRVVQNFDLYELLLKGDTSQDARIQPGDVIFVPPVGETVGIAGEVRRPAIYEIKKERSIPQLIKMAGGLLPTAYSPASQLERINSNGERTLINVDFSSTAFSDSNGAYKLRDGDTLRIFSVPDQMEHVVYLSGHVQRPGGLQWFDGMRLSDAIPNVQSLLPKPGLRFVLVRRERQPDRLIKVLVARLDKVFADNKSTDNLALLPQDKVFVFGLTETALGKRTAILSSLVKELREQVSQGEPESVVTVKGNVQWPGEYPLPANLTLPDLLRVSGNVKKNTDLRYILLVRETSKGTKITTKSFDFTQKSDLDIADTFRLMPRDKVFVFGVQGDRQALLSNTLIRLKQQATLEAPSTVVSVNGLVRSPGEYPLEPGMMVSDIIRTAGGLVESAYSLEAEISRSEITLDQARKTEHLTVKLDKIFAGDTTADTRLISHDRLTIKRLPYWAGQRLIEIKGEVRFPGRYPVSRDETLLEVIQRAGGLTDQAFPEGAILVRESLRKKEQEQLDKLQHRLESDLAAIDLEKTQASVEEQRSAGMASSLLDQLRATKAMGRLVINLPGMLQDAIDRNFEDDDADDLHTADVLLRNGDKLFIPPITQEVTILGEVQYATSHLYSQDLAVNEYIGKSGGLTYRADEDRIYIVRANGEVLPSNVTDWFSGGVDVRAGDTIVVPLDAERLKPLTLWTSVSQIVYQIGIAAASWNAVGIF